MELSFEQAVSELEQIVEKLDCGCVALEEMIKLYERGIELTEHCRTLLNEYEGRMDKVVRRDGTEAQDELF